MADAFSNAWRLVKSFEDHTSNAFTEHDLVLFAHLMGPMMNKEDRRTPSPSNPLTSDEIASRRLTMDYPITGIEGGLTPHDGSFEEKMVAAGAKPGSKSSYPVSWVDKMPGPSFNTSSDYCHAGGHLRDIDGAVCGDCNVHYNKRYGAPTVQNAMERRYQQMMSNPVEWGRAMVSLIPAYSMMSKTGRTPLSPIAAQGNYPDIEGRMGYMRWHDSGDLQGPQHLALLSDIARATPSVNHWIPTKDANFVNQYLKAGGQIPKNLIVRLSSPMIGQGPTDAIEHPQVKTSTVGRSQLDPNYKGKVCPASKKGSEGCIGEECNACWQTDFDNIDYELELGQKGADPFATKLSPKIIEEIYDNYMQNEDSFKRISQTDVGRSVLDSILNRGQ